MPSACPIELSAPDLAAYRTGNTGVEYVTVIDSGRPGPNVMVQALTHGNEICGAIALDWLLREAIVPPSGKLTLAFANMAAYARFDVAHPNRSRFVDEDLNRVWADDTLFGTRDSAELRRARELQPFVDAADFLLDLHSMNTPCRPLMVCGMIDKGIEFARRIGLPADLLVDTGHPAGLRMRDRGGFNDPASPRCAALVECGQHWEKSAADVAIDTLVRFLAVTGVVSERWAGDRLRRPLPARQQVIRVTEAVAAKTTAFRLAREFGGLEVLPKAGTVVATDGDTVWRTPYDDCVMVMPSMVNVQPGKTMVRLGRFDPA